MLKQRENQVHELEVERGALRQELNDGRMKMNQSGPGIEDALKSLLSGCKDEIEVSESKKVRLEATTDPESLARRLELLELDNKRLTAELRVIRESKESIEAKFEALEADKVRLEIELVRERSKRGALLAGDAGSVCSSSSPLTTDSREKEMNASVAIVSDTSSQENASGSDCGARMDIVAYYRDLLAKSHSTYPAMQELRVTFTSCNPGDTVFVVWDTVRSHYIVIQESRTPYILNPACIDVLELWLNADGTPKVKHILGEVVDKQYCHAKKVRCFFCIF